MDTGGMGMSWAWRSSRGTVSGHGEDGPLFRLEDLGDPFQPW